nr:MAG TPA_asm: tail sheath protein [Caudoviricetes sp.]
MILDFPVKIQRKTVGVSERGFGTILILDNEKDRDFEYLEAENLGKLGKGKAFGLATRLFMQKPQAQEVAIVGKVGKLEEVFMKAIEANKDFFFVVGTDNAIDSVKEVAKLCQINNKLYAVTINNYDDIKGLGEEKIDNVFVAYHDDPESYLAEGLAVVMSFNIGGKTAKFKKIEGVKEAKVSDGQVKEIHEANAFTYIKKLGVLQTTEGKVLSGEYIDVVLGEYWIRFRIEERMQRLAITQDKIPYTNRGIAMLVSVAETVLNEAVDMGIIEENQYKIDYRRREDVPSNDVAARKYDYIAWTAMLQGAIHSGQISGLLTYDLVNKEGE